MLGMQMCVKAVFFQNKEADQAEGIWVAPTQATQQQTVWDWLDKTDLATTD